MSPSRHFDRKSLLQLQLAALEAARTRHAPANRATVATSKSKSPYFSSPEPNKLEVRVSDRHVMRITMLAADAPLSQDSTCAQVFFSPSPSLSPLQSQAQSPSLSGARLDSAATVDAVAWHQGNVHPASRLFSCRTHTPAQLPAAARSPLELRNPKSRSIQHAACRYSQPTAPTTVKAPLLPASAAASTIVCSSTLPSSAVMGSSTVQQTWSNLGRYGSFQALRGQHNITIFVVPDQPAIRDCNVNDSDETKQPQQQRSLGSAQNRLIRVQYMIKFPDTQRAVPFVIVYSSSLTCDVSLQRIDNPTLASSLKGDTRPTCGRPQRFVVCAPQPQTQKQ